jgi:hypothetical protein
MAIGRKRNTPNTTGATKRSQAMKMVGTHPPTHPPPTNTQPPLTHAATTSNINVTSTITASITTTVIIIHFMPTITFTIAIPSLVALSVIATYDKNNEKG